MPAIQRYKIHSQEAIIHEVTELNRVGCWRSQNSIADSSTTARPILDLMEGGFWTRRHLRSGIKDVSVASKPMKSLTLVGVVFIGTLALRELDGRFLKTTTASILILIAGDHWARCQPHSGIKDVSVAAKLRKSLTHVRVVFIDTLALPEPEVRCLHGRSADSGPDCGRLLASTPATQRYKGCLCPI